MWATKNPPGFRVRQTSWAKSAGRPDRSRLPLAENSKSKVVSSNGGEAFLEIPTESTTPAFFKRQHVLSGSEIDATWLFDPRSGGSLSHAECYAASEFEVVGEEAEVVVTARFPGKRDDVSETDGEYQDAEGEEPYEDVS
ncbi:hypothetical protein M0R45_017542 [Rubus argutus]|uniref:Uncharacterized protein n=1 Tax=Rubus argutus TaxID=59490 RepID=A0AAW1XWE8_RUBAR